MANIIINKNLANNIYTVSAYVENYTEAEAELIADFGQQKVVFGGIMDITNPGNSIWPNGYVPATDATFSVVQQTKAFDSQLVLSTPLTYSFNSTSESALQENDMTLAEAKATDMAAHIQYMIEQKWAELGSKSDTFTEEVTVVLPAL